MNLSDLNFSSIEELPFDIRGHRITTFNSSKKDYKENLTITISTAISSIIKNFNQIIEEQNKKNNKYHDLNLYNNFTQICSEAILLDSLSLSVNSLHINKYYLEKWDSLQEFYKISENIFIDKYLDETVNNFLKELDKFDSLIARDFYLDEQNNLYKEYLSLSVSNIELTEEQIYSYKCSQVYKPTKSPVREETWPDANKRILDLQKKLCIQEKIVKATYKEFVMAVKKNLL